MKDQSHCVAPEGLAQIEQRLIRLENLLVDGLNQDISTHLDIYVRRLRKMRADIIPVIFFADAVWDILLELNYAGRTGARLSTADLAALVDMPQCLLDRYLELLQEHHLVWVADKPPTSATVQVRLTRKGADAMQQLFDKFVATVNDDLEKARLARRLDIAA